MTRINILVSKANMIQNLNSFILFLFQMVFVRIFPKFKPQLYYGQNERALVTITTLVNLFFQ